MACLMRASRLLLIASIGALPLSACVSLAPGADKVRITKSALDVSRCTAVGNINVSGGVQGPSQIVDASQKLRNQAVGLGGNAVFVTVAVLGVPSEGVVYRCP
jgi:hypothetical protein